MKLNLRVESGDMNWATTQLYLNNESIHCWGFDLSCRVQQRCALIVHYTEPLAERTQNVHVLLDRILVALTSEERATILRFLSQLSREQASTAFDLLLGD